MFDENEQTPEDGPLLSKKNCFLHAHILLDGDDDEDVLRPLYLKLIGKIHGNGTMLQYSFSTHLLQKRQGNGDMLALNHIDKKLV